MKKFGVRDQIGYAFGDVAGSAMTIMSSYFMVFCTYVLGVSPAFMGTLFLFAKIWDAINDPLIGQFPDRWQLGKSGDRFKPYVKLGIIPMALFIVLMYADVSSWASIAKHVWVCVMHVAVEGAYTLCTMPYGALSSVITTDPVERAKLSRARTMGSTIMGLALMIIVPQLIVDKDNHYVASMFLKVAIVCAVIMCVAYLLLCSLTQERIRNTRKPNQKFEYVKVLRSILKNRPLIGIMIATLGSLILLTGTNSLNAYLFMEYFHQPKLISIVGAASLPIMLIAFPLTPILVRHFGKKKTLVTALLSSLAFYMLMLLWPTKNPYIFIALSLCASFGQSLFTMLGWAMVTDCVDYQEYQYGERNDGSVFSIYAFSRKLGGAIASTLASYSLVWAGFDSLATTQVPIVGSRIRLIICIIPVIACLVELAGIGFVFNLSTKQTDEISAELASRREHAISESATENNLQ